MRASNSLREQAAALLGDAVGKIVGAQTQKPGLLQRRIDFGVALIEPRTLGRDRRIFRRRAGGRRIAELLAAHIDVGERCSKPSVGARKSSRTGSRLARASTRAGSVMPSRPIDCSI